MAEPSQGDRHARLTSTRQLARDYRDIAETIAALQRSPVTPWDEEHGHG